MTDLTIPEAVFTLLAVLSATFFGLMALAVAFA